MLPEQISDILKDNSDQLFRIKQDIDKFLDCANGEAQSFCEGDSSYQDWKEATEKAAINLQKRIYGLAMDLGIQNDFLKAYQKLVVDTEKATASN